MRRSNILGAMAFAAISLAPSGLAAQEQLPWGPTQQAQVITPDTQYQPQPYQPPATGNAQPPTGGSPYPQPLHQPRYPNQYSTGEQPQAYGNTNVPPEGMAPEPEGDPNGTYEPNEIVGAGHRFFGRITTDLASVVEYSFQHYGRPNGYILGEEGGGAFIAGLRYGEGRLYTKNAGDRKVYWQGPSIGYDFGGEGSKTMILVYNMHSPDDVYYNYTGVSGQAYVVGGVGITYLKSGPVTMAPIRSGLGLRLGANVGYLKFTRAPTWNPF
jgi:hypothetical protein